MAIQFVTIRCPECGANLQIEDGREYAFCTYCGAKVMIANDNEHIYRTIDEARIKQAETDRMVQIRHLDMEEESSGMRKTLMVIWIIVTLIFLLIGIVGIIIGDEGMEGVGLGIGINIGAWGAIGLFSLGEKKKPKAEVREGEIAVTGPMTGCVGKNYNNAVLLFKSAGFTNINAIPLHDLTRLNQKKNGQVEMVTINGNDEFDEEDVYPKTANILITYHCA